jgi:hypothetical protein
MGLNFDSVTGRSGQPRGTNEAVWTIVDSNSDADTERLPNY